MSLFRDPKDKLDFELAEREWLKNRKKLPKIQKTEKKIPKNMIFVQNAQM